MRCQVGVWVGSGGCRQWGGGRTGCSPHAQIQVQPCIICLRRYTDIKHVPGMQYLYTAVLHQPTEGLDELGGEAGSASGVSAGAFSGGAHDGAEVAVEQLASGSCSSRAVLVKYTTHVGYGKLVHSTLAQHGLAPALHSCTPLPGRLVEVSFADEDLQALATTTTLPRLALLHMLLQL
jgi:hypothetical protein